MASKQRRRQSSRSEGALKWTELLHIKNGISQLQIMRYFNNFAFMSEKKTNKAGSVS